MEGAIGYNCGTCVIGGEAEMNIRYRCAGAVATAILLAAVCAEAAQFSHGLKGERKPWTGEGFLDDPQEFHFAIVSDRTGGERKGFFGKAMDALNLLRPEFVMSVGDLIACGGKSDARAQWEELEGFLSRLEMPFFHVVGNHDIWTGFSGMTPARRKSIELWKEFCGTNTYYSFIYKGCQFICLDSMEAHDCYPPREPLPEAQLDWASGEMERNADARWHFIFIHKPLDFMSDRWLRFERKIRKYDYTVFCGDWHTHCTAVRHGKKYHIVGTTGGGIDGAISEDLSSGTMDSITWVTVTKKGPVVSNIAVSGVHGDFIQTCATTKGWIEAPLDYPSHLAEPPEAYADEKNTALIPAEVMEGPGYDWHFRHAVILRQGKIYQSGMEKFKAGKRRVVLLGDETASAASAVYPGAQVFDMGFKGDRTQNVIWRIIQGELAGYDPDEVLISVGVHNFGNNTVDEIKAALLRIVSLVRARVPRAKVTLLND